MDNAVEIPNIFWKYYDLYRYRRKKITLKQFSDLSGLSESKIVRYLDMQIYKKGVK